jgi:hypothetical protein
MKCDLCEHRNMNGGVLCEPCAGMIQRLVAIERRMKAEEGCEATRLAALTQTAGATRG